MMVSTKGRYALVVLTDLENIRRMVSFLCLRWRSGRNCP